MKWAWGGIFLLFSAIAFLVSADARFYSYELLTWRSKGPGPHESEPVIVRDRQGRELVVVPESRGVVFRKLTDQSEVAEFPMPLDVYWGHRTPVFDEELQKLYGLVMTFSGKQISHFIFSADLERQQVEYLAIDPLIEKSLREDVTCTTGVALVKEPRALVFGCSLLRMKDGQFIVNSSRNGLRGRVFIVRLTESGGLPTQNSQVSQVYPSRLDRGPKPSGRDSSVWMSGDTPQVTSDGHVVVTTGNGRVDPASEQYGCAIVLVNVAKSKITASVNPAVIEGGHQRQLCEEADQDLTSSGVSRVLDGEGKEWFGVGGKDGRFRVFSREQFHRSERWDYTWVTINEEIGQSFGTPVGWRSSDGNLNWIVGTNTSEGWKLVRLKWNPRNLSLEKAWTSSGSGWYHRASPALSVKPSGQGMVAFTVRDELPETSSLLLVAIDSGQVLEKLPFVGNPHFTRPTFHQDSIFLSIPMKKMIEYRRVGRWWPRI